MVDANAQHSAPTLKRIMEGASACNARARGCPHQSMGAVNNHPHAAGTDAAVREQGCVWS